MSEKSIKNGIDPWFYGEPHPQNLSVILEHLTHHALWEGAHHQEFPMNHSVTGVASLKDATPQDISYYTPPKFGSPDYTDHLKNTRAGVVLIQAEHIDHVPASTTALVVSHPYRAFAALIDFLYDRTNMPKQPTLGSIHPASTVHPTAVVHPDAVIEEHVIIGPLCVIEGRAHIEKNTHLIAHVYVGRGVRIGSDSVIEPHVTLQYAKIGHNVYIKTGARIGQDGFGFDMDSRGPIDMPQMGSVHIHDHVKIGANTCIDRATLHETTVEKGARIDNLVQIAHNVHIGAYSVLVAQVGIAGSTTLGMGVMAGGQAGLSGHIQIGDGARIAAQSGVMRSIPPKTDVAGSPSLPARDWHKQTLFLKRAITKKPHH